MCKRNSPKKKLNQYGMCKRNSPDKKMKIKSGAKKREEANTGCVRETPLIKERNQEGTCQSNSPDKK